MFAFDPKLTIFIPHIYSNWANANKIKKMFESLQFGIIDNVYLYKNNKKSRFKNTSYRAYISFTLWYNTHQNINIQENIYNNKAKFVYDDPWYWILLKARNNISSITSIKHGVSNKQSISNKHGVSNKQSISNNEVEKDEKYLELKNKLKIYKNDLRNNKKQLKILKNNLNNCLDNIKFLDNITIMTSIVLLSNFINLSYNTF